MKGLRQTFSSIIRAAAMAVCGLVACRSSVPVQPGSGELLFRDPFNGVLEDGWSISADDASDVDLEARGGFARIFPPPLLSPTEQTAMTLLLREMTGDFVLITRMEFQTVADLQLAGLVVQGDDGRTVVLGLFSATSPRGSLRGLFLRADRGSGVEPGRAIAPSDLENIYLRLERTGNRYTGSFSTDGRTYETVGSVTNDLSARVDAGIGTALDQRCSGNCAADIHADFDFFTIEAPMSQ